MDFVTNFPLNLHNVKHLLPLEIFDELFFKSIPLKENQNRPNSGNTNIVNGLRDGVTVQAAYGPSTHAVANNQIEGEWLQNLESISSNEEYRALQVMEGVQIDWRLMRWEKFKQIEESSYTVFVDNIRASMTRSWLWQLFEFEGEITDIYLSRKKRKSSDLPFAFVRYAQKNGAQRAIANLDGTKIRDCKITVKVAKYVRNGAMRKIVNNEEFMPKNGQNLLKEKDNIGDRRSYRDVLASNKIRTNKWVNDIGEKKDHQNISRIGIKSEVKNPDSKTRVVYGEMILSQWAWRALQWEATKIY